MYAPSVRALQKCSEAKSFGELAGAAVENLREQCTQQDGAPCVMVCGPMTTGGTGNQFHNFSIIISTIHGLERNGLHVFNQVLYEEHLHRLVREWKKNPSNIGYCMPILEIFYRKIFETRFINQGLFVPRWQTSLGARFENDELPLHGTIITELTPEQIGKFMGPEHSPEYIEKILWLLSRPVIRQTT